MFGDCFLGWWNRINEHENHVIQIQPSFHEIECMQLFSSGSTFLGDGCAWGDLCFRWPELFWHLVCEIEELEILVSKTRDYVGENFVIWTIISKVYLQFRIKHLRFWMVATQRFFYFHPGEMMQLDEHIFSDGLVQPPTILCFDLGWLYTP